MRIFLDESIVQGLAPELRRRNHEVLTVEDWGGKGISDQAIWPLISDPPALLLTRDHHFTASLRYDPTPTLGVIYLRHGNLKAADEIDLVLRFLDHHPPEEFRGCLVTLSPHLVRIR